MPGPSSGVQPGQGVRATDHMLAPTRKVHNFDVNKVGINSGGFMRVKPSASMSALNRVSQSEVPLQRSRYPYVR